MGATSREIRLKSRPVGLPSAEHFEIAEVALPDPGPGQVLIRNMWMSVDPYMRGRMYDRPSYSPPFQVGEAMQGGAIGRVEKSNDPSLKAGDLVESMNGWREAFVTAAGNVQKLPSADVPAQAYLGVLGMPGLTAYSGLASHWRAQDGRHRVRIRRRGRGRRYGVPDRQDPGLHRGRLGRLRRESRLAEVDRSRRGGQLQEGRQGSPRRRA